MQEPKGKAGSNTENFVSPGAAGTRRSLEPQSQGEVIHRPGLSEEKAGRQLWQSYLCQPWGASEEGQEQDTPRWMISMTQS